MLKRFVLPPTLSLLVLGVGLINYSANAQSYTGSREGASDASVYYPPNDQLESFFVANDGAINVLYKTSNGNWRAPIKLTAPNFAPPGANITAVYYPINDQLEVFTVGNNGAVKLLWKAQNRPWNPPAQISSPNFAQAGGKLAATYYPINDQLEVFAVGNNGAVNVLWKAKNGPWNPPAQISPPNFAP